MALLRLTFLFALYLALDVSNPMMPGALVFSAEDSIEAYSARRLAAEDVTTASARVSERLKPIPRSLVASLSAVSVRRTHRTRTTRPRLLSDNSPVPSEDD
jgi:hypothetical protein